MEKMIFFSLLLLLLINTSLVYGQSDPNVERAAKLKDLLHTISRQVMLQQFYTEERVRSDGNSGLKQKRIRRTGSSNYYAPSFGVAAHNHANNQRTIGMGEFVAVLNGVEFRTRHNDYRLYMPHRTSAKYNATENIEFPPVPEEVKNKLLISDQIAEMREFFKAWRDQNITHRDYRPHFKPILCYLEGAWTVPEDSISEPFESDRHFVDAKNWFDLMDKIRYTSYTGTKSHLENLSFLPTAIMGFREDKTPIFAQWNYRIMCHPLKNDLPLSRLRLVDDLAMRMPRKTNILRFSSSREARFQINPENEEKFKDRPVQYQYIDDLMAEIPGKDNYQGKLVDTGFDQPPLNIKTDKPLDVSRYHRWFNTGKKDAMGLSVVHRGFSDNNMFAAMTTQSEVAGMQYNSCDKDIKGVETCVNIEQKWSYAIPLEIIYLTPLYEWNPYDIEYKGESGNEYSNSVNDNGRNGGCEKGKEFNGSSSRFFYITPAEFFSQGELNPDAADTTLESACVLDRDQNSRVTKATGTRVDLPDIAEVGILRQRYPIFPAHSEGSAAYKELNALKDMVMDRDALRAMTDKEAIADYITLKMSVSRSTTISAHTHYVELESWEIERMKWSGVKLKKKTTEQNGHSHTLEVMWETWNDLNRWRYYTCDGGDKSEFCFDDHAKVLYEVDSM